MVARYRTYGSRAGQPAHWSYFREAVARRAGVAPAGRDAVHEYLIGQANLRGFHGAFSTREELGVVDASLDLEDIIVGLLQPHAPAEPRILKLVLRILQAPSIDPSRLWLRARRERADAVLAWLIAMVPEAERTESFDGIEREMAARPPRGTRTPDIVYDPTRLQRRPGLRRRPE